MKRILLSVLILLCVLSVSSQTPSGKAVVGSPTLTQWNKGVELADSGYQCTNFVDTFALNRGWLKGIAGLLVRVADTNIYVRNNAMTRWVKVGGSGGINNLTLSQVLNNGNSASGNSIDSLTQLNVDEIVFPTQFGDSIAILGGVASQGIAIIQYDNPNTSTIEIAPETGLGAHTVISSLNVTNGNTSTFNYPILGLNQTRTVPVSVNGTTANTGGNIVISSLPPSGTAGGDLTGTYPNPTLIVVNSSPGVIGDASHTPVITVDSKGRSSSIVATAIQIDTNHVTGYSAGVALKKNISDSNLTEGYTTRYKTQQDSIALAAAIAARGITALTGDVTASGTGSVATTLATVNTNTGSWGTATSVPTFTVNGKGLVTAAGNTSIQIPESQVTNLTTDLGNKQNTVSLTTTGSSGASTFNPSTGALNIPNYVTPQGNLTGDVISTGLATTYNNVVPSTKGGAGSINAILKANGSGVVSGATGGTDYEFPLTFSSPLSRTSNTISIPSASASVNGYLNSTDWNTFNNKQTALGFTPENVANKTATASTSTTTYPNWLGVENYVSTKQNTLVNGNGTTISGEDSVNLGGNLSKSFIVIGTRSLISQFKSSVSIGDSAGAVYGSVFTDNFQRASLGGNYSTAGTNVTITFPSSLYLQTDSGKTDLSNYILRIPSAGFQEFIETEFFTPLTMNVADSMVGTIGLKDTSAFITGFEVGVSGTPTNKGKVILKSYNGIVVGISTALASYSIGDSMYLSVSRIDNIFITTLKDLTVGGSDSVVLSYTIPTNVATSNFQCTATGYYALFQVSGHCKIYNFNVTSNEPKYVPCINGNSIAGGGYTANYEQSSWPYLLFGSRFRFSKMGGSGDLSTDLINNLALVDSLHPRYAFDDVSTNDVGNAIPAATFSARSVAWVANCQANNIIPIFVEITPNPNADSKPFSDTMRAIVARTSGVLMVQGLYNRFKNSGNFKFQTPLYSTDTLHPNNLAHSIIDSFMVAQLPAGVLNNYNEYNNSLPLDTLSNNYLNGKEVYTTPQGYKTLGFSNNTVQFIGNPLMVNVLTPYTFSGASAIAPLSILSTQIAANTGGIVEQESVSSGITGTQFRNAVGTPISDFADWDGAFGLNGIVARTLASGAGVYLRGGGGNTNDLVAWGGAVGIGSSNTAGRFSGTPAAGMIHYNTDSVGLELYTAAWNRMLTTKDLANISTVSKSGYLSGQTAAQTIVTTTSSAADTSYQINAYVDVTTLGIATIQTTVTYTNENNASTTATFFGMSATPTATLTSGSSNYPPMFIRAKASTTITVATTVTGSGGTYNAKGSIILVP